MKRRIDIPLLISFILLVLIGLMMVYSASNVVALYKYNDKFYFFKRQFIFGVVGILVMFFFIKVNLEKILDDMQNKIRDNKFEILDIKETLEK